MGKVLLKSVLVLLFTGLFSSYSQAQYTQTTDMEGKAVHEYNTVTMQGSPFLYKEWAHGVVSLSNGKIFDGLNIMYDQVRDVLLFKTKDGQIKELIDPIHEFKITFIHNNQNITKTFRKGYSGDGASADSFFEVLADGKASLLKRTSKKIFDRKGYNSATIEREVQESHDYYIAIQGQLIKVKQTKSSLLSALPNASPDLNNYIKSYKPNLRSDEDLAKLVAYYNSL